MCVNNSWSGSFVTGDESSASTGCGNTRTSNLHNNNTNENPDIIVIYMGTNDANNAKNINAFTSAYNKMVSKIKTNYPSADIYLCTVDNYKFNENRNPVAYNEAIKSIAAEQDCTVVDFYSGTSITPTTIAQYTVDSYLHPNAKGMTQMYECVRNALAGHYQVTEADDQPIFDRDVIETLKVSGLTKSNTGSYMYLGSVNEKLSGKTVTRIGVPIMSVADCTKESSFTVYVADSTAPYTKHETYEITIPANRFSSNTVNQWVYFDVNIKLEEGQSLAYQCNDTAAIGYKKGALISGNEAGFINIDTKSKTTNSSILLDIFVK